VQSLPDIGRCASQARGLRTPPALSILPIKLPASDCRKLSLRSHHFSAAKNIKIAILKYTPCDFIGEQSEASYIVHDPELQAGGVEGVFVKLPFQWSAQLHPSIGRMHVLWFDGEPKPK